MAPTPLATNQPINYLSTCGTTAAQRAAVLRPPPRSPVAVPGLATRANPGVCVVRYCLAEPRTDRRAVLRRPAAATCPGTAVKPLIPYSASRPGQPGVLLVRCHTSVRQFACRTYYLSLQRRQRYTRAHAMSTSAATDFCRACRKLPSQCRPGRRHERCTARLIQSFGSDTAGRRRRLGSDAGCHLCPVAAPSPPEFSKSVAAKVDMFSVFGYCSACCTSEV